jgi:hypothetical protein
VISILCAQEHDKVGLPFFSYILYIFVPTWRVRFWLVSVWNTRNGTLLPRRFGLLPYCVSNTRDDICMREIISAKMSFLHAWKSRMSKLFRTACSQLCMEQQFGTSCYHLVTALMRPTDSQQVVLTSLISSTRNKLLNNTPFR